MIPLAFDLDGTLVDTREANLRAYRAAGAEPPAHFHRVRFAEWHGHDSGNRIARRKAELYPAFLETHGRALPLYDMFVVERGGTVLTGASLAGAEAVRALFPHLGSDVHCGMTLQDKLEWLRLHPPGVYFDDDKHACRMVSTLTKWRAVCVLGLEGYPDA
jgi:hypothetical protein